MEKKAVQILSFILLLFSFSAYVSGAPSFLVSWSIWVIVWTIINLVVWQHLMRLATFTIVTVWVYAWIGNIIPQSTSGPAVALGDIERTPEAFIAAGEAIFHGKGKCATCHTIGGGATKPRCPDLENIGKRAQNRKPNMSARDYLIESLYMPSAYLVPGYGNIMPEVWKPPISLSSLEIEAVIAFLQSLGGKPDLTPIKPPIDISTIAKAPQRQPKGNPEHGKYLFYEYLQCNKCHKVGEQGGEQGVGPDLSEIGALNTVDYLEESILDPNAKIVSGYGSTTITLKNGKKISGLVVNQDEKNVTIKLENADQTRTIAKKDIVVRPIRRLNNLMKRGYFWIQAILKNKKRVSGTLIEEDENSLTVKTENNKMVKITKNEIARVAGRKMIITSKMPKYDNVVTIRQLA